MKPILQTCGGLKDLSRTIEIVTSQLEYFAWALPGRWPDPFVILKRADRTGVKELPLGGELWGYPRPVL